MQIEVRPVCWGQLRRSDLLATEPECLLSPIPAFPASCSLRPRPSPQDQRAVAGSKTPDRSAVVVGTME
jgi:hypothetical protein